MPDDKLAMQTKEGEWICGVCVSERNQKIIESMSRRRGVV